MEVRSQYEYHFSFTGSSSEKPWEDFSLSGVTNVQKKNSVFRENYKTFQFSTLRDENYSINTIQIAILYIGYLMKKNKVGGRKEKMYFGGRSWKTTEADIKDKLK